MSGKQSKQLRRMAMAVALQAEESGRRIDARGTESVKVGPDGPISMVSSNPADYRRPAQFDPFRGRVMIVNRRDTYRGIVRELKKGVK